MTTVATLTQTEYRGIQIIVRQVGDVFEYLFFHKGKWYGHHNVITRSLFSKLLGLGYRKEVITAATRILLTQATTSIDMVLGSK